MTMMMITTMMMILMMMMMIFFLFIMDSWKNLWWLKRAALDIQSRRKPSACRVTRAGQKKSKNHYYDDDEEEDLMMNWWWWEGWKWWWWWWRRRWRNKKCETCKKQSKVVMLRLWKAQKMFHVPNWCFSNIVMLVDIKQYPWSIMPFFWSYRTILDFVYNQVIRYLWFVLEEHPLELGPDKAVRAALPRSRAHEARNFPHLDPHLLLLAELREHLLLLKELLWISHWEDLPLKPSTRSFGFYLWASKLFVVMKGNYSLTVWSPRNLVVAIFLVVITTTAIDRPICPIWDPIFRPILTVLPKSDTFSPFHWRSTPPPDQRRFLPSTHGQVALGGVLLKRLPVLVDPAAVLVQLAHHHTLAAVQRHHRTLARQDLGKDKSLSSKTEMLYQA